MPSLILGCWLVFSSFIVSANDNLVSKIFFKIIPFFLGLLGILSGIKQLGWI